MSTGEDASRTELVAGQHIAPIVQDWSENTQRRFGDCFNGKSVHIAPKGRKFGLCSSSLTELRQLWEQIGKSGRDAITDKYGRIGDLLSVPIDVNLLRAAAEFWDPSYRCFCLKEWDLTPTLEEYAALLGKEVGPPMKVFMKRKGPSLPETTLSHLFDLNINFVKSQFANMNGREYVTVGFLIGIVQNNIQNAIGRIALALAIYGIVLFPTVKGGIDAGVVDFFSAVHSGDVNPIPTILAETFRSLNHCRQNVEGRFHACPQLLNIWIQGHFTSTSDLMKGSSAETWISDFGEIKRLEKKSKQQWMLTLFHLKEDELKWISSYMKPFGNVIFRCGDFYHVPLLGVWGEIGYTPLLVLRQFGIKQFTPATHSLKGEGFVYARAATDSLVKQVANSWKQIFEVKRGIGMGHTTFEYKFWFNNKKRDVVKPPGWLKEPGSAPIPVSDKKLAEQYKQEMEQQSQEWRLRERELQLRVRSLEYEDQVQQEIVKKARSDERIAKKDLEEIKDYNRELQRQYGSTLLKGKLKEKEEEVKSLTNKAAKLGVQMQEKEHKLKAAAYKRRLEKNRREELEKENEKLVNAMHFNEAQYLKGLSLKEMECTEKVKDLEHSLVKTGKDLAIWEERVKEMLTKWCVAQDQWEKTAGEMWSRIDKAKMMVQEVYQKIEDLKTKAIASKQDPGQLTDSFEEIQSMFLKMNACVKFDPREIFGFDL